jgi:hypothetical protein
MFLGEKGMNEVFRCDGIRYEFSNFFEHKTTNLQRVQVRLFCFFAHVEF